MYVEAFRHHIRENGVRLLKFDNLANVCQNPNHEHLPGIYSTEPIMDAVIEFLQALDRENPDVFLMLYWGYRSPWWLLHGDTLFDSGMEIEAASPSTLPAPYARDSVTQKLDQAQWHASDVPALGKDSLGVWLSDWGWNSQIGKERWQEGFVMDLCRGSLLAQPWSDTPWLTPPERRQMAEFIALLKARPECFGNPRFVLGNPQRDEPYGYCCTDGQRAFIALHNCAWLDNTLTLQLKPEWGLPDGQAPFRFQLQRQRAITPRAVVQGDDGPPAVGAAVAVRFIPLRIAHDESRIAEALRPGSEQRDELGHLPPFGRREPRCIAPRLGQQAAAAQVHDEAFRPPLLADLTVPAPVRQPDAKRVLAQRRHVGSVPLGLVEFLRDAVAGMRRWKRARTGRLDVQPRIEQRVAMQQPPGRAVAPVQHQKHVGLLTVERLQELDHGIHDRLGRVDSRQMLVAGVLADVCQVVEFQQPDAVFPDVVTKGVRIHRADGLAGPAKRFPAPRHLPDRVRLLGIDVQAALDLRVAADGPQLPGTVDPQAKRRAEFTEFFLDACQAVRKPLRIAFLECPTVIHPEIDGIGIEPQPRLPLALGHLGDAVQYELFRFVEAASRPRRTARRSHTAGRARAPRAASGW